MIRRTTLAIALATLLLGGGAIVTHAQQNGLVIENNGVDNTNSAAGADNVRISRAPGNSQSNNGGGANNEERHVVRQSKDRDRSDKGSRKGGDAAPADAVPTEGNLEAYSGDGYTEPAAPQEIAEPQAQDVAPIKLPNTGAGPMSIPWAALAAMAAGASSLLATRRFRLRQ
ncbi:MAG: LPXTG cell wall anchor domain-containing protein [Thermomicrobiales bacterium]